MSVLTPALIALLQTHRDRLIFREIAWTLPEDDRLLGRVSLALARNPGGAEAAEALLEQASERFPNNDVLRNMLARVVASDMQPDDLRRAIVQLRQVPRGIEFTCNQLAQCLLALGDPASRAEALSLIEGTAERFGETKYTKELREIAQSGDRCRLREIMRIRRGRDKPSERDGVPSVRGSVAQAALRGPPAFVLRCGSARKLRFDLELGTAQARESAVRRLRDLLATDPTFAYAQILAERHGVWRAEAGTRGTFALAFERALRDRDAVALANVASEYPRWELLPATAKALFGDVGRAAELQRLLTRHDNDNAAPIAVLRTAILSGLRGPREPANLAEHLSANATTVTLALHEASEATIGEFSLAA